MSSLELDPTRYFPADPGCYGCRGTGFVQWAGFRDRVCSCVQHDPYDCEPGMCSPECRRRRELRELDDARDAWLVFLWGAIGRTVAATIETAGIESVLEGIAACHADGSYTIGTTRFYPAHPSWSPPIRWTVRT